MRIVGIIISCLIMCFNLMACGNKIVKKPTNFDLVYGDDFEGFNIYNIDGTEAYIDDKSIAGFYVSNGCGSCGSVVRNVDKFRKIFQSEYLDYMVLWEDEVPKNLIQKYALQSDKNYSLNGESKLFVITPSFFILKDGKIDFQTEDIEMFLNKIASGDYESRDNLIKRVNNIIVDEYKSNDKPTLLYFAMEGCNDCKNADEILKDDEITNKYDIIKLYRSSDPDDGRLIDKGGFFAKVYDIDWYPTFVKIFDEGYEIIREVAIEDLKEIIMK